MAFDPALFKRSLEFQDSATCRDLNEALARISEFDQQAEATRRTIHWTMLGTGLGVPLSFVIAVAAESPLMLVVMLGCIVAFVVALIMSFRHRKYDLTNRRYQLTQELIRALSRDMAKDGLIQLSLGLSPVDAATKLVTRKKLNGWDIAFYEDPWLTMEADLADGTAVQIAMIERFQSRTKRKRSASGKLKSKSKSRSATSVLVRLSPRQKSYPQLDSFEKRAGEFVKIPDWATVKSSSGKPGKLLLKVVTSADWSVRPYSANSKFDGRDLLFAMLHSLYEVLRQSKTIVAS